MLTRAFLWKVYHTYPLDLKQKTMLAERITYLHATRFNVPSLFISVVFQQSDASSHNYFTSGKAREYGGNRIAGMLRVGGSRTAEDFENLAEQIEDAWYDVVKGERITEGKEEGKRKGEVGEKESDRESKRLMNVLFYTMHGGREFGIPVPRPGEELNFVNKYMKEFQKRAENGEKDFVQLLEELNRKKT
ncbi:hypothetical protein F5884DRAFT_868350 [Xylogone sp. PMI_703]|nr:hypothetical protein F5884DRAFT_868350 [Xylogone sp. PMI_703]